MKKVLMAIMILGMGLSLVSCSEETAQKGTIKGKVTNSNVAVNGAYVMLLDSGQMMAGNAPLSNGSITGAQGNYTIYLVEPNKNYFVCAVQDMNGDAQYTPGVDKIGYYGNYQGQSWIPTEVHVGSGEVLSDINITALYVLPA